jgi:glycosyltransferase involved in cell wall biosynthesis
VNLKKEKNYSIPNKKIVTIIYRLFPHYRYAFFRDLHYSLEQQNIELNLVYGKYDTSNNKNEVDIDWGIPVKGKVLNIFNQRFFWIPSPRNLLKKSDLIIIMQENKILSNYPILFWSFLREKKIAFWGHGINFQSERNFIGNKIKKIFSTRVSWWFAYTQGVSEIIENMGVAKNRITVVENSFDTESLINETKRVDLNNLIKLKKELGIGPGPIGIYCGAMYKEKRIDFLIQACQRIHKEIDNFEMLFLGSGSDSFLIQSFCDRNPWAHYVGQRLGNERIPYFKISDIFLLPGAIGLAVLDSFIFEVPMITAQFPFHGPEIEYLIPGYNGILTENEIEDFSNQVITILGNKEILMKLKKGCSESKWKYTNKKMVNNFTQGVIQALAS